MKKATLYIFHATLFFLFTNIVMAEESVFRVLNYDILSAGDDVGDVTLKLSKNKSGHLIVEHSRIQTSWLFWSIDITTIQSEEFQRGVGLVKADSKTVFEGTAYWSKIDAHEDKFLGEFTEIAKLTAREEKQFSRLSFAISGKVSANTEEVVSLSEAIFSERNEQAHSVNFPQDSFDTTFNDLALFIQKNADKPLPKKLNILDTENLEISQVSISDIGLETILVGKQKIEVRHLKLSDTKSKPSHLWITEGVISLPYIVRHTGEDEDGPFEIILKAH